jgi:hypothetical protein
VETSAIKVRSIVLRQDEQGSIQLLVFPPIEEEEGGNVFLLKGWSLSTLIHMFIENAELTEKQVGSLEPINYSLDHFILPVAANREGLLTLTFEDVENLIIAASEELNGGSGSGDA